MYGIILQDKRAKSEERAKRLWLLDAGREKVLSSSNLSSLSFTMAALRYNLTVRLKRNR